MKKRREFEVIFKGNFSAPSDRIELTLVAKCARDYSTEYPISIFDWEVILNLEKEDLKVDSYLGLRCEDSLSRAFE